MMTSGKKEADSRIFTDVVMHRFFPVVRNFVEERCLVSSRITRIFRTSHKIQPNSELINIFYIMYFFTLINSKIIIL